MTCSLSRAQPGLSPMRTMMSTTGQLNVPDGQEIVNRVFIGGLARETSELELENFFSTFGEVIDVRIVADRKTGINKGYGFVTFSSTNARDELLKKGTIDYINGRKLRLRKAVKKEASGQFFTDCSMTTQGAVANQLVLIPVMEPSIYSNPMPAPAPPPYYQVQPAQCYNVIQPAQPVPVQPAQYCLYYY